MEEGRDQPSLERMEYMQSVFSMCDSDSDGVISVDELRTIVPQIGCDEVVTAHGKYLAGVNFGGP